MGKETGTQVQEAHKVPYRINTRRKHQDTKPIKLTKIKEKNIESNKGKAKNSI